MRRAQKLTYLSVATTSEPVLAGYRHLPTLEPSSPDPLVLRHTRLDRFPNAGVQRDHTTWGVFHDENCWGDIFDDETVWGYTGCSEEPVPGTSSRINLDRGSPVHGQLLAGNV